MMTAPLQADSMPHALGRLGAGFSSAPIIPFGKKRTCFVNKIGYRLEL